MQIWFSNRLVLLCPASFLVRPLAWTLLASHIALRFLRCYPHLYLLRRPCPLSRVYRPPQTGLQVVLFLLPPISWGACWPGRARSGGFLASNGS